VGEEIAVENGRISDFQRLVTLTLDQVILHTVMHHSSTSTYIPNVIEIEETFCGRTDVQTDRHLRPTLLGRLGGDDLTSHNYKFMSGKHIAEVVRAISSDGFILNWCCHDVISTARSTLRSSDECRL